jgi:hypothetical protein
VALARPRRWTPIFFLDDAVALAAGHRPCGECRIAAYRAYRDAVTAGLGRPAPLIAGELNARLRAERHGPGRGLDRAGDRLVWTSSAADLPDGTVVVLEGDAHLLHAGALRRFAFAGWGPPKPAPAGRLTVLTPPTSTLALAHGYPPVLHPTASSG